jgi:multiple sugar transport system substrate-binding protein
MKTQSLRRRRARTLAAAALALAVVAAACGDDDDDTAAPTATTAGGGAATSGETTATTSGGSEAGTATTTGGTSATTGGGSAPAGEEAGVDDGSTIAMWTRAATETQSQQLVDAYNASHENQVDLTVIPTDDYLPRVGTAAGAGELPDVLSLDVVFVPQFTTVGAFLDITDKIDALPYADSIAPSHVDVGTLDDKKYTVPHTMDLSVYFYNKDLYEQAGLDPETPPATLEEFAEQARAVNRRMR